MDWLNIALWVLGLSFGIPILVGIIVVLSLRATKATIQEDGVKKVEELLAQKPALHLQLAAVDTPILPSIAHNLTSLGFGHWSSYGVMDQSIQLHIASHSNNCVAVVYQHGLLGTWFEIYAQTSWVHLWSNSPLFDGFSFSPLCVAHHHPLLTIHDATTAVNALEGKKAISNPVKFVQSVYQQNAVFALGQPLQEARVLGLLFAQKGDVQSAARIQHAAQANRDQWLEELAWDSVGGMQMASEGFVVHPYSVDSEDIHMLLEHLRSQNLWSGETVSHRVPESIIGELQKALPHSQKYSIRAEGQTPLPALLIGLNA